MRIFLDTNVFIVGSAIADSAESIILTWIAQRSDAEIIISTELIGEIRRVGRRVRNKDWASRILHRLWQECTIHFVLLDQTDIKAMEETTLIPREDIEVYLTAKMGSAHYFVSANHKLARALIEHTKEFVGLTPEQFVEQHIF